MGGVEAVLEALALCHQLGAQTALGLELLLRRAGRRPGAGFLGAGEVGHEGRVEPVGLVAAEGGLGIARHGQGLEHADGVAGRVGGPGDGLAVGAGGFQADMERAGRGGPGQQPGVALRGVGHGDGAGLRGEQAGVELVLGDVEAQDGLGRTHEVMLLRVYHGAAPAHDRACETGSGERGLSGPWIRSGLGLAIGGGELFYGQAQRPQRRPGVSPPPGPGPVAANPGPDPSYKRRRLACPGRPIARPPDGRSESRPAISPRAAPRARPEQARRLRLNAICIVPAQRRFRSISKKRLAPHPARFLSCCALCIRSSIG